MAVIDGAAPHDVVQTFRPSASTADPGRASIHHDIVPLLLQGRALLLHWTADHIHYEPVLPGVAGWRLPGRREVAGVDLGSGSEMASVGRSVDVSQGAIGNAEGRKRTFGQTLGFH